MPAFVGRVLSHGLDGWLAAILPLLAAAGLGAWHRRRRGATVLAFRRVHAVLAAALVATAGAAVATAWTWSRLPYDPRKVELTEPDRSLGGVPDFVPLSPPPGGSVPARPTEFSLAVPMLEATVPAGADVARASGAALAGHSAGAGGELVLPGEPGWSPCPGSFVRPVVPLRTTGRTWQVTRSGAPDGLVAVKTMVVLDPAGARHLQEDLTRAAAACRFTVRPVPELPDFDQAVHLGWRGAGGFRDLVVLRVGNVIVQVGTRLSWADHGAVADRVRDLAVVRWSAVRQHDGDDGSVDGRIGF